MNVLVIDKLKEGKKLKVLLCDDMWCMFIWMFDVSCVFVMFGNLLDVFG